jgi:hypothetical protein
MENTNEQTTPNMQQPPLMVLPPVPNATTVLVLGILSIVGCWCWGVVGVVLGIIALTLASKANAAYVQSPQAFSQASFKNLKAGKICAIIGLSLSGLALVTILIEWIFLGAALTSLPWDSIIK